jgi:hypothetical protein
MNSPFWTICSPSKLSFSFYFVLLFILNLIISLNESGVIIYFFLFFCRYASESNLVRYAKIAMKLKDKTVRDVALRCRWMTVSANGGFEWLIISNLNVRCLELIWLLKVDYINNLMLMSCFRVKTPAHHINLEMLAKPDPCFKHNNSLWLVK